MQSGDPPQPEYIRQPPNTEAPTARFGIPPQNNLHVSVNTETLNIHASSLDALERLTAQSPEVAMKLIEATNITTKTDADKYRVGAIAAAIICCTMLISFATITVCAGIGSGLAFFLVCVAAAAIVSAIFTGKSESLSWTVGFFRGSSKDGNRPHD